jgi:hypothetical protein
MTSVQVGQFSLHIDLRNEVISRFGGFLLDDEVVTEQRTVGTIIGARGPFLWLRMRDDGSVSNWREDQLRLVEPNRTYVQLESDRGVLLPNVLDYGVMSSELGLCDLIGADDSGIYLRQLGRQFPERFPRSLSYDVVRYPPRTDAKTTAAVTKEYKCVNVFRVVVGDALSPYDRVLTASGHGTILGQDLESRRFVVLSDREFFTSSLCELFDAQDIQIVGKMRNVACEKRIVVGPAREVTVRIDPLAFAGKAVTICDRVRWGDGKCGYVCGIDKGDVYVKPDDRPNAIKMANERTLEVVMRYAMMPLVGMVDVFGTPVSCSKSIINFAARWIKPGDILQDDGADCQCFGIRGDGSCVFVDVKTRSITIREIDTIDLACIRPDRF